MAASGVYSLEPTTRGCVRLKTTAGDLLIDLFARECPLAVRNFCQLCVDGAYNGTPFHRVVPGTLVQAGDEKKDLSAFENGQMFKDEFHSRLEFRGRGFVAMANEGRPNSNRSQFFITLKPCPWLNRKHTIFGIVRGDPVFVAVKIGESPQENERALHPHKILAAAILEQPFTNDEIKPRAQTNLAVPREVVSEKAKKDHVKKALSSLSFADEEDDEQLVHITKKTPHALKREGKETKTSHRKATKIENSSSSEDEVDLEGSDNEQVDEIQLRPQPEPTAEERARDSRLSDKLAAFRAKRKL